MIRRERFSLPGAPLPADANVRYHYPINRGKWVVHPAVNPREISFCRYSLEFTLPAAATIDIHVSADNRFELLCDGMFVGMGPDRSDLEHWSFHSYRLTLEAGTHQLSADVHFMGLNPADRPWAQTYIEPAFVLFSEHATVDLNTGSAPWKAALLGGVTTRKAPVKGFFVVGPNYTINAQSYFAPPAPVDAVVVRDAGRHTQSGTIIPGWKLHPSRLPEQLRQPVGGGHVRIVASLPDDAPFPVETSEGVSEWQAFIEGRLPVSIPAHTRVTALWDLEQYHTAYPELTTAGGRGARVSVEWAEACLVSRDPANDTDARRKGHRNEVAGKYFVGNGDTYLPDGPRRTFPSFWWRAGRYIRIAVETADEALTLERLRLLETRLPLEQEGAFHGSDPELAGIAAVAVRGIQMCAHETYMDCPYYEQMMYVGDTRLQMLTSYVMSREDRLNQRALEIFDWSRQETGFVLERCPSHPKQLSCTFAMIWLLMLRDYAWWRRDPAFVRLRLKGMRCMLEEFKALPAARAPLLPALPGWSFMDWVNGLSFVNNPGPDASVSAVVNLLFLNAVGAAAELEAALGEPELAQYNRAWADRLAMAVDRAFWDEERSLFADDPAHAQFSEHAQCLALLSGRFPARDSRCFGALITDDRLIRTTMYFSFYLLEAFARFGRGDLVLEKFGMWKDMVNLGLKTPLEMPEPSRSDCHAWSSHPLFHMHASLAGIRPAAPGFAEVLIAPSPGGLTEIRSVVPHPEGVVDFSMRLHGERWRVGVALPPGVRGVLRWAGVDHRIEGQTELELAAGRG